MKFPAFIDKHFPANGLPNEVSWRRAFMVGVAKALIMTERRRLAEDNPTDEFLQQRFADATYNLGWDIGWMSNAFTKWKSTLWKNPNLTWAELITESHNATLDSEKEDGKE